MENYPYSYPESHDSSPRSRDNESWDDQQPPSSYKVKFMCSYGGKIHPRPNDNQLAYVGGETKIFAVDRNIRFSTMISKLSTLYSGGDYNEVSFKYQLPGEDLDALISVTNDEDLEHMMLEYDRLYRSGGGSSRPARLRLFLFPLISSNQSSFSADDPKPNQQWFVDALNSVPIQSLDSSASPAPSSATDSDFIFGFEKQRQQLDQPSAIPPPPPIVVATKLPDPKLETAIPEPKIVNVGNDSMYEIERQIHDLQRLQISKQEQHHLQQHHHQQQAAMFQRKNEENLNLNPNLPRGGAFHGDYYMPEKQPPTGVPVAVPVPVPPTAAYWQQQQQQHDRNMNVTGGYSDPITGTERLQQHQQQQQLQQQQQVYLIPSQGMYQTPATNAKSCTGQVGHGGQGGYYGMQRVVPDVYREQPVYTMGQPPGQQQMQQAHPQMQKMMMGETGPGGGYATTQVGYDSTGRQVYYTTTTTSTGAPSGGGGVVPSSYPTAVTTMPVDPRQPGPLNQEGKVLKPAQANV